jgi:RNA polymerase sigma-70 factor (ECF subfamily)
MCAARERIGRERQCKVSRLQGLTDEALYRLMRQGRQEAFAELYERHEPALFRYALHMSGSREDGEEIAHEAFVRLLDVRERFDERRGALVAYLYGIARNLVRESRRRVSVGEPEERGAGPNLPGALIERERVAALHAALARMPVAYRDAVVLCDLEELSYEEAARRMGCPVGTVRSRVHRGRLFLAGRLRPVEAPAPAAGR